MKRTILIFVIATLVLISVVVWALTSKISGNTREIAMIACVMMVVGFAVFAGFSRIKSHLRKEPFEDELSKQIMLKTSSLSYYISIYLWLFIMYLSDKVSLESHTMIGIGILGMAIVFVLCWIGFKLFGFKNE